MATFTGTTGADSARADIQQITGFTGGSVAELIDTAGDLFIGRAGDDTIYGGLGSDTLRGGAGNDVMIGNGGQDFDTVDYSSDAAAGGTNGIRANMRNNQPQGGLPADTVIDGFGDTDTIDNVRNIIATGFGDVIYGGGNANRLDLGGGADFAFGFDGDDTLLGGEGADTLDGGEGFDQLLGGDGDDLVVWDAADDLDNVLGGAGTDTLDVGGAAIPTAFDLAAHGFEGATAARADAEDNWWASYSSTFDASWQTVTNAIVADDGRTVVMSFDTSPGGTGSPNRYSANYRDQNGILTNSDGERDDGSRFVTTYDWAAGTGQDGVADWLNEFTYFFSSIQEQADSFVRRVEGVADDGRRFTQTNDVFNTETWTYSTDWTTADGVTLDFREVFFDNGTTQIIPY